MKNEIKDPICSIVILSYNQLNYTKKCLDSIRKYTDISYEIIIVDNNSSEPGCLEYLLQQKDIILIQNKENRGFAGGCNQGIEIAKGKYIMLLNNDTVVTKNWLTNMVDLLETNPDISMTGPLTNATVGKQQISVDYGEDLDMMQEFAYKISTSNTKPWRTLRLVFFCVLIRKEIFQEVGLLDEDFLVGNYEDDDFNLRMLMMKKKMYICRNSYIHHFMNVSFTKNNLPREEIMMKNKIILENKWSHIDWNYYAGFNPYFLKNIQTTKETQVLHLGCGLGTLAIELKDRNPYCHVIGIEDHLVRKRIAEQFLDKLFYTESYMNTIMNLENHKFDFVIIEGVLEKEGLDILEKLKPCLKNDTQIFVRVFNSKHVTTLEKILTGEVGGNLICASSKGNQYYFDEKLEGQLQNIGYHVLERLEVKKLLSIKQKKIMDNLTDYHQYQDTGTVYNYIYKLTIKQGGNVTQ